MDTVPYFPEVDPEAYLEYCQTSKTRRFKKIVNGCSDLK